MPAQRSLLLAPYCLKTDSFPFGWIFCRSTGGKCPLSGPFPLHAKNSFLYFQRFNGDGPNCGKCEKPKEEHYLVNGRYYCPVCCISARSAVSFSVARTDFPLLFMKFWMTALGKCPLNGPFFITQPSCCLISSTLSFLVLQLS